MDETKKVDLLNAVRMNCMLDRFDSKIDCQGHDVDPDAGSCYEACESCGIGKYIAFKEFGTVL